MSLFRKLVLGIGIFSLTDCGQSAVFGDLAPDLFEPRYVEHNHRVSSVLQEAYTEIEDFLQASETESGQRNLRRAREIAEHIPEQATITVHPSGEDSFFNFIIVPQEREEHH